MWEGHYGSEPFDLRLTVLRALREGWKILVFTLVGTFLFGGGYYLKNVVFGPDPAYKAVSTYRVKFVVDPTQSGDYFINEMTLNTLVYSEEFLDAVQSHMEEPVLSHEEICEVLTAQVPSDWHILATTVQADEQELVLRVSAAVEAAMTKEFVENAPEVEFVRVIDPAKTVEAVYPDVRPERALILSAILSFFFGVVLFLLQEIGSDRIWLPKTLGARYGLPVLGTLESKAFSENVAYRFGGMQSVALCPLDENTDVTNVSEKTKKAELISEAGGKMQWISMPAPMLCPESCKELRRTDGILLVVPAGICAKKLEAVLELFMVQDCKVTAAVLTEEDAWLLRWYYGQRV